MQQVITRINGGLGNQMFQYAAGRALAERLGCPLKLDLSEFSTYELRRFELDLFNISIHACTPEETQNIVINPRSAQRRQARIMNVFGMNSSKIAYKERHFEYHTDFARLSHPCYLTGYWQSEKYFLSIQDLLRAELQPKHPLSDYSAQVLQRIQQTPSVSLHIRRGDYVTNPAAAVVHGVCPLDYYQRAVEWIGQQIAEPHFYVFSDDPDWAKQNLHLPYPCYFIDANGADKGIEDMWLMRACQHHIIANSSFSWWGAWLNPNPNKKVVAPQKWFQDSKLNTQDLIPDSWYKT